MNQETNDMETWNSRRQLEKLTPQRTERDADSMHTGGDWGRVDTPEEHS